MILSEDGPDFLTIFCARLKDFETLESIKQFQLKHITLFLSRGYQLI